MFTKILTIVKIQQILLVESDGDLEIEVEIEIAKIEVVTIEVEVEVEKEQEDVIADLGGIGQDRQIVITIF